MTVGISPYSEAVELLDGIEDEDINLDTDNLDRRLAYAQVCATLAVAEALQRLNDEGLSVMAVVS